MFIFLNAVTFLFDSRNVTASYYEILKPSFFDLVPDYTSKDSNNKSMEFQRQRRYYKFNINPCRTSICIYPLHEKSFVQNVTDFRNEQRVFHHITPFVRYSSFMKDLLFYVYKTSRYKGNVSAHVHQVRQLVSFNNYSDNSPEGIHRDGADFIMSAFVVNKYHVYGGESRIYSKNFEKVFSHTLEDGQGIVHEDRVLSHDVTRAYTKHEIGYRDIIGIDLVFK